MHKKTLDNARTMLLLFFLVLLTNVIDRLPWWSFVIPVLILGVVVTLRKWQIAAFAIGSSTGFIIWFGASLYFDATFNGNVLDKIGLLLSVPKIVVFLISGVIGGLLTGLALYTGKSIVAPEDVSALDHEAD